jgi:hypothetical protein
MLGVLLGAMLIGLSVLILREQQHSTDAAISSVPYRLTTR